MNIHFQIQINFGVRNFFCVLSMVKIYQTDEILMHISVRVKCYNYKAINLYIKKLKTQMAKQNLSKC